MLNKPLTDALVQAYYMSGDRNTIATALKLLPKLGVLLLGPEGEDPRTTELKDFYQKTAPGRCEVCKVAQGQRASALEAVKAAYQEVSEHVRDRKKAQLPGWIGAYVHKDVVVQDTPYGTAAIAGLFNQGRGSKTQDLIRKFWRLEGDSEKEDTLQYNVWKWLELKGFRENRAYVFLFAKEGARTAEKAHHFTSILTWRLLAERISCESSVIPVAVGDDIGLRTTPTLVKFWNDSAWVEIFMNSGLDPRSAQMGMWCFLAEKFDGVSIIGMRSGILEVPGLLGIRTLYLEEAHNAQANRMVKWEEKPIVVQPGKAKPAEGVPGWTRQVVQRPPGIAQQIYWRKDGLGGSPKSETYKHVEAESEHAEGLVYGSKNPQEAAKAVFGREALSGQLVPAEKFQLATSEFDSIVKWAKATPVPKGATGNVHGAVPGILELRDVARQDLSARKKGMSYSDYFKSEEFRSTLPNLSWKTMK